MAGLRKGTALVERVLDDLAADIVLERDRRRHVGAEAEAGNVDDPVVGGEIVQNVALRLVCEHEVARDGQQEAADQRHGG